MADFIAQHDLEMEDLRKEMDVMLGPEDKVATRTFIETVSGNRGAPSRQSKLALDNPKVISTGAIPEGPDPKTQFNRRPNSKFSDGPLIMPNHTLVTTTTITTTVEKKTHMEESKKSPAPSPKVVVQSTPPQPSPQTPKASDKPAVVPTTPPPAPVIEKKEEEAPKPVVNESVRPPLPDSPKESKLETMKTIAGFVNLSNPPSKAAPEGEKPSVKVLQNEFYKDRIADSVALRSDDPSVSDKKHEEIKSNEIAKAPSVATPAELLQKAALEKAKAEEAKRKAEEEKNTSETKKKHKSKKIKTDPDVKKEKEQEKKEETPIPQPMEDIAVIPPPDEPVLLEKVDEKKKKKDKKEKKKEKKEKKHKKHHKKEEEEKKKKHKKHKKDDKEKKKSKDKDKKKKKKKKTDEKKKKKKKGNDFIIDDEAESVDAPLSDEEGSLDSEEAAAENASDDSILPDTDGEDSISDADGEDVDEDGNLAGFVADDIEYLSGVSDEDDVEEIHGRSEHLDFADRGHNIKGKAGRRLVKKSEDDKKHKKHHSKKHSKDLPITEELEEALRRESEEAGIPIPEAYSAPQPTASVLEKPKSKKRHIEDDDDEVTPLGKAAESLSVVVPLSKTPVNNFDVSLTPADLQPVIYKMILGIAGFYLAELHWCHKDVTPSDKPGSHPRGQHVADIIKYNDAVKHGMVVRADQQCCSVFRCFFAPDADTTPDTPPEHLSLSGLSLRIFKELGRLGALDADVANKIISPDITTLTCFYVPVDDDQKDSEMPNVNFTLTVDDKDVVLNVVAPKPWAEQIAKVVFWFKASEAVVAILHRFVISELKRPIVRRKPDNLLCTKTPVIKSYSDIGPLISTQFIQKYGKDIHDLTLKIINSRDEAINLLKDLRNS